MTATAVTTRDLTTLPSSSMADLLFSVPGVWARSATTRRLRPHGCPEVQCRGVISGHGSRPLLPISDWRRGRPFRDDCQVVEGIIYRHRRGIAWRDLPAEFGGAVQTSALQSEVAKSMTCKAAFGLNSRKRHAEGTRHAGDFSCGQSVHNLWVA